VDIRYRSFTCPAPTTAAGNLVDWDDAKLVVLDRIERLAGADVDIEGYAEMVDPGGYSGCADLAWKQLELEQPDNAVDPYDLPDGQMAALALTWIRNHAKGQYENLYADECRYAFDGVRWHVTAGGVAIDGDPNESYTALVALDLLGVLTAPIDGGEFHDAAALAGALAVLDLITDRVQAATAAVNLDPDARAALEAALTRARTEIVPAGRLLRQAMTLAANRQPDVAALHAAALHAAGRY